MNSVPEIKEFFCRFIDHLNLGVTPMVTPTNDPAPHGTYIAVRSGLVQQHGRGLEMAPTQGTKKILYVVTLHITEVEGDGEALRKVRNAIQGEEFKEWSIREGLALWDVTDITEAPFQDGDFWINQKYFECRVNFQDDAGDEKIAAKSVSGKINDDGFSVELN